MANVNPFRDVTGILGAVSLGDEIASVADVLRELQTEEKAAIASGTKTSSGSGASSDGVLGAVENVFGIGLSPLVSGLVSLFGGGDSSTQVEPLVPYLAPPPVNVNAGFSASATGVFAVDQSLQDPARPAPSAQVTVNVQAFDSKSFLDHSQDIAAAVRQAMLESTTLNDVIREV